MKNDLSVDFGMVQGIMQKTGFSSKGSTGDHPQESFDAIFENSFQKAEEMRSYATSKENERNQESKVESRSRKPEETHAVDDTKESRQVSEREDKPAMADSDNDDNTADERGEETTTTVKETRGNDESEEAAVKSDETVNTSMLSIQKEVKLNNEQLSTLAQLLGVTIDELSQMKIEISKGGEASITATLPDGTEIDLGEFLQLEENGKILKGDEAVKKLAALLNIDKEQAEAFVKKLGLKSIEITGQYSKGSEESKGKSQSPFFTGKAAESKVVENTERKTTVEGKGEKLQQTVEQAKGEVKADMSQVKSDFGAAMKETAAQVRTSGALKAETVATVGAKVTSEQAMPMTEIKEVVKSSTSTRVFSQIVEKAQVLSLPNRTEARISLTPANLGTVDIKIIVQDAQVKGTILVDNQQVKKIVEENLNSLKTALADQGINVEEITVDINDRNTKFEQQNEAGKDSDKNLSHDYAGNGSQEISDEVENEMNIEEIRRAMRNKILDVTA